MTLQEIMDIVREEDFDVTLSGGDPLCTPKTTKILVEALKKEGRNVWLYTGYTWNEIIKTPELSDIVSIVDTVVDGPFVSALHDPDLLFRGSSNQNIIHVKQALSKI